MNNDLVRHVCIIQRLAAIGHQFIWRDILMVLFQRDKGHDGFAVFFIGRPDNGCFPSRLRYHRVPVQSARGLYSRLP